MRIYSEYLTTPYSEYLITLNNALSNAVQPTKAQSKVHHSHVGMSTSSRLANESTISDFN